MKPLLSSLLLLAACSPEAAPEATNQAAPAPTATPSVIAPKAFAYDEQNDLIEFHYGWSAEAAAVPQLVERFRANMAKVKAELLAGARADKSSREAQGFDFNQHSSSTEYETAGQSARLLSLRVEAGGYSGGAHGNSGTVALLWDRPAAREIKVQDLFAAPANMSRLLTQRWCDALNKAREEKRGEPVGADGMFDECPPLSDLAIIPADTDDDGMFEKLLLVASPYVAGPYVEGSYEIELAMTPDLRAALKEEYRPSFEVQTQ